VGAASGSGMSGVAGKPGSAGAPGITPSGTADSSGCSCRVGQPAPSAPRVALSLLLVGLAGLRRMRPTLRRRAGV
jgi:MYXO-CTERM domain-containing protein